MVFERLQAAIKTVVGVHPGVVGRVSATIGSNHTHSGRHFLAMLVTHTQLEATDLPYVMPLPCCDASPRAAEDFLDPERGIAVLVTDITDPSAVRRKPRLNPIEVPEGQWERCGTLHGRQPELLPLATVITAKQDLPATRCDLRLRAPRCFFTKDFFQILWRVHSHGPDIAGSVGHLSIRHKQQTLAIGRP